MREWLVLMLVGTAFAGCLSGEDSESGGTNEPGPSQPLALDWNVGEQIDWWEYIATNFPKHDSNLPTNTQLRKHLVSELRGIGMDVEIRTYPGELQGQPTHGLNLYAIIATKTGLTMPDHRIGLVSHYDSQSATIMAAYDDMSGVAAEFSICKALMAVPLDRTLACIFFDGEERGLVASREYVKDVVVEGDEPYVYDIVLGYDMTGINWPGYPNWKMYVMTGPGPYVPNLVQFAEGVLHNQLLYPREGVEVLDVHDRNSDERRFREAGIPILRFAGGRNAADYDQYHRPLDTVDHVYQYVGGRPNFESGFAAIVEGSYATILALDKSGIDAIYTGVQLGI